MPQQKKSAKLKIHPAPFKPSYLSIPPSPFSPRTPLTPPALPQRPARAYPAPDSAVPLPLSPLQWLWTCHQCHQTYSLGVTRRCLEDGHHFCAGITSTKNWRKAVNPRKVRRHRACASEFDYAGWKSWGRWKRSGKRDPTYDERWSSSSSSSSSESCSSLSEVSSQTDVLATNDKDAKTKDCWNTCDYPSECRWGTRFGVHTPIQTPSIESTPQPPAPTTFEGILKAENVRALEKGKKAEKPDFWSVLIASATRRRNVSTSSPLARIMEEIEPEGQGVVKDRDGDVVMSSSEPVVLSQSTIPGSSSSSATAFATSTKATVTSSPSLVTLKEVIKKKSKRGKFSKPTELKGPDPVLQISPAASEFDFDFRFEDHGDLHAEFAPLERVRSKDSGYHSTSNSMYDGGE